MEYHFSFRHFRLADNRRHIITDRFRQTGGMHRHNIRIINFKHIFDRGLQIGAAAKYRGAFGKAAGGGHHRIAKVPGQVHPVVGATAL